MLLLALSVAPALAQSAPLGRLALDLGSTAMIVGEAAGDEAGGAAWARDDLDGDGVADLVLGAPGADAEAGLAAVLLGPLSGTISLADADRRVSGTAVGDRLGWSVASPGDQDGDGRADLVLGAPEADGDVAGAGAAYAWYALPAGPAVDVADADARWQGVAAGDEAGVEVCPAGDTDGDGRADLLVAAWYSDVGARDAGSVYVLLDAPTGAVSLSTADGTFHGGAVSDWAGYSACGGGDVDADGYDDIVIGADGVDATGSNAGAAYLVRGPAVGSALRARAVYQGEAAGDYAGHSVAIVGDTDGDGDDDVLVGSFGQRRGAGTWWGAAYLLDGTETGRWPLRRAPWKLYGNESGAMLGYIVAPAGDVDADGYADVTVGMRYSDAGGTDAGAAWLLYGPLDGRPTLTSNAALLVGTGAYDETSWALDHGDLDGDGYDDVVLSAPWNDTAAADAGRIYVVAGGARD